MSILKKYRTVSLWIIWGFAVTFILFDYIIQANLIREIEKEDYYKSKLNYRESIRLEPIDENISDDLTCYLKRYLEEFCEEGVTLKVVDFNLEDKVKINYIENCDVWISDTLPGYPLYKGNYPTKEQLDTGKGYAVISYSRKSDVYIKDNIEYIDFNGEAFEVTGYFSKYSEWLVNNGTILFVGEDTNVLWECMARYLADGWLWIELESDTVLNHSEQIDELNKVAQNISEGKFYIEYIGVSNSDECYIDSRIEFSKAPTTNQVKYVKLILFFVVVMLCCVIDYWLFLRKMEFKIRRKNGYSIVQIGVLFYKDMFIPALIGGVVGKIVECIFIFLQDGYIVLTGTGIYNAFLIMLFCLFATTILIFIVVGLVNNMFKNIHKLWIRG